jgi:hypothetical protein
MYSEIPEIHYRTISYLEACDRTDSVRPLAMFLLIASGALLEVHMILYDNQGAIVARSNLPRRPQRREGWLDP